METCGSRLAEIANRHQKTISIAAHLGQCPHVTAKNRNASANNLALIRKFGQGGIKGANLTLHKVASPFRELPELQQTDHDLRRVEERESATARKKVTDLNVAKIIGPEP